MAGDADLGALTERFEDAAARLVVVFRVGLVGGVLGRFLLPVLVAGPPAMASPPPVALGHVHADVDGMVTCKGPREQSIISKDYSKNPPANQLPPHKGAYCANGLTHFLNTVCQLEPCHYMCSCWR